MTIKVWCRVRSGVDHEVVEFKTCTIDLVQFVVRSQKDGGIYSGDRFIPWHQITYIEVAECPPPTLPA